MVHSEPHAASRKIQSKLPRILERLAQGGDMRGLAKAHMAASTIHWLATNASATAAELRLVADFAREAGDAGMRSRALAQYVLTLIYGPEDAATVASEIDALEKEDVGPHLEAFVDLGRGELERLAGNRDGARTLTRRAIEGLGSLGAGAVLAGLEQDLGQVELSFGEPAAALAALLRSDAICAESGVRDLRSTTQALLAEAHERLGNLDEARAAIDFSDELTATEDVLNAVHTHRVRARLALHEGDATAAESWARSAVEYARRTDFTRSTAQARLDFARVLLALACPEAANAEARAALHLYESKCDRPGITEATAILAAIATAN
jgi:tetratricopeptide (TPR) repeat protein